MRRRVSVASTVDEMVAAIEWRLPASAVASAASVREMTCALAKELSGPPRFNGTRQT